MLSRVLGMLASLVDALSIAPRLKAIAGTADASEAINNRTVMRGACRCSQLASRPQAKIAGCVQAVGAPGPVVWELAQREERGNRYGSRKTDPIQSGWRRRRRAEADRGDGPMHAADNVEKSEAGQRPASTMHRSLGNETRLNKDDLRISGKQAVNLDASCSTRRVADKIRERRKQGAMGGDRGYGGGEAGYRTKVATERSTV